MLAAVLYHFAGPEALARGDAELASLHFDEAIELCRAAGDRSNELSTWLGAALAFLEHDQALAALRFLKGSTGPIATHGTTYQRRLVLLLIADVARRHGEAELAAQLRTSACTGTTAFSIHVTEHSTPHNRMVAALMARLPADEIEPLPLDRAFDRACRWLARLPSLDSLGSVPHV